MCGIVGKLFFDSSRVVDKRQLEMMNNTLVHRGPDGAGVWCEGNVGLAHRRLAVIDLRPEAAQPMCNENGTIWITFNGEIYNFRELRNALEARGHRFRSKSDTESIIHAYEEYGHDCVKHLRGMFAFAIWDGPKRLLFVARDRVGKKPLYYLTDHTQFVFGSEIKAILKDSSVRAEPNSIAIDHFLTWQYIPAPHTAFMGIHKLPAAHWMEIRDGQIKVERYWKLHFSPKQKVSYEDAIIGLHSQLEEAVRVRLESDVPLGAFLSGGVDSSAVVASMAHAIDKPVLTFSAGFADDAFDERPYAKMVADQFNTHHTELLVNAPVADLLPKIIWHYDEPFGDSSAVPSFAIAQLTSQYVTVALNGDGGDENFAGYERYIKNYHASLGDIIPRWIFKVLLNVTGEMPECFNKSWMFQKFSTVVEHMSIPPQRRYAKWLTHFSHQERHDLYSPEFRTKISHNDPEGILEQLYGQSDAKNWIDATLDVDINSYLTDDLLVKMDRATMAHGLETRSPFLDHHLMEYVATLPANFKLKNSEKKRLLKSTLRGILPDTILHRPKMGFGVPLARWFKEDLKEMSHDVLLSRRALQREFFMPNAVENLLAQHGNGMENHSEKLWDLLVLELWHRTFIDGELS